MQALMKAGADVNALEKGKTQLRLAAAAGKQELVLALLEAGADPNVNNTDEMTPLRSATGGGAVLVFFIQQTSRSLTYSQF
jgi:ankyrin repeat protein